MFKLNRKWVILLVSMLLLLLLGQVVAVKSEAFIKRNFKLIVAQDLLFYILPQKNLSILTELLMIFSALLFVVYVSQKKLIKWAPYYLFLYCIFIYTRSLFVIFTPLATPFTGDQFGILSNYLTLQGLFPSGHTSVPFMAFLYARYMKDYKFSVFFLILFIIMSLTMMISRGHYTIDIIGTIFISYTIVNVCDKHFKKYFDIEVLR